MHMKTYPSVLTIAGSDCSGGAGIQADIKAISALGGYAASAITAVTVQNTVGVNAIHPIPADIVRGQIDAVMTDICPKAIKIGMINDVEIVKVIAEAIQTYHPQHVVFDPVMISTSGYKLIEDEAIDAIKKYLIPLATIITPNLNEAKVLYDKELNNIDDMKAAAKVLLGMGCKSILIKGGHLEGNLMCDILQTDDHNEPYMFCAQKVESRNTHGTGCTLSSAIATCLALGMELPDAVASAKDYVFHGIEQGKDIHIGEGHGPLNHFYSPQPMHIMDK